MPQVDAVLTPATAGQAIGALMAAGLTRDQANVAAAQSAVETASWKYMRNWNLGNITTASDAVDWMVQSSTNPLHFVSYANILAGAQGMAGWFAARNIPLTGGDDYFAAIEKSCYLGCVAQGTPQSDYDTYKANILAELPKMQAATPVAPGWSTTKKTVVLLAALIVAYAGVQVASTEPWVPRRVRRTAQRLQRLLPA